ncbi:MAG TPA: hypothetical protein VFB84_19195 [Micromonosporaceae bacterium]|nr:hypothetical protein [Micromonosporaceae bacterium]
MSVDSAVTAPAWPGCPVRDPAKARWYPADADFVRGCQAVDAAAAAAGPALVQRTGLVIFTPGCLVAGQLDRGVELLAGAGFEVVLGQLVRFTPETVRRVWRYQLATFRPDRWQLILDLLLAGPSLLMVVRDRGGGPAAARDRGSAPAAARDWGGGPAPVPPCAALGGPAMHRLLARVPDSAADRLTGLKGKSDPRLGRPGELRTELGAMNKIINLVHSAEETADVVRECAILLDEATLSRVWSPEGGPVRFGTDHRRLAAGVAVRPAGVSFAHTATALRWRIVAAVANRLPPDSDLSAVDRTLTAQASWLDSADSRRPLAALAGFRHRFAGQAVTAKLRCRVPAGADPVADRLLDALDEVEAGLFADRGDADRLWCACDQAGLPVDPWERLVVSTQYVTVRM